MHIKSADVMLIKYPLGIQTFSKIRDGNYLYVDKTDLIYELIAQGSIYFLSRPRRFGKSLLISTLEALFKGQKQLFDGLAIADTDYDFEVYPVLKFEFSNVQVTNEDDLREYIVNTVNYFAKQYDIELTIDSYEQRFAELVRELHAKSAKRVVLLVDEYDKPILDNLFTQELKAIRSAIAGFYAVAKQLDEHLKFIFITGVSKFAKVSVFSGMNNLTDISMDRRYAAICGVTEQELEQQFQAPIDELAEFEQIERNELLAQIKHWYNGYRFHHRGTSVYNPYSLLSLFSQQEFKNYWFSTGTPTFLLNLLKTNNYNLKDLTQFKIGDGAFEACEPEDMEVQSVFLQTGYLTIEQFDGTLYQLKFPNYEVKKSFHDSLSASYGHVGKGVSQGFIVRLTEQISAGQLNDFFETLSCFFANIPYDLNVNHEKYYQSLFYAIFTLIGFNIEAEVHTNQGRIDCVLHTNDKIYVIEFKLNDTKEAALAQIHTNKYPQKYQQSGKELVLIGVEFDQDNRNIGEFVVG